MKRSIPDAIDILDMCRPIRCDQGGFWFGRNHNFADATFVDYGAADAFATAAEVLPILVKALTEIAIYCEAQPQTSAQAIMAKIAREALGDSSPVSSQHHRSQGE